MGVGGGGAWGQLQHSDSCEPIEGGGRRLPRTRTPPVLPPAHLLVVEDEGALVVGRGVAEAERPLGDGTLGGVVRRLAAGGDALEAGGGGEVDLGGGGERDAALHGEVGDRVVGGDLRGAGGCGGGRVRGWGWVVRAPCLFFCRERCCPAGLRLLRSRRSELPLPPRPPLAAAGTTAAAAGTTATSSSSQPARSGAHLAGLEVADGAGDGDGEAGGQLLVGRGHVELRAAGRGSRALGPLGRAGWAAQGVPSPGGGGGGTDPPPPPCRPG